MVLGLIRPGKRIFCDSEAAFLTCPICLQCWDRCLPAQLRDVASQAGVWPFDRTWAYKAGERWMCLRPPHTIRLHGELPKHPAGSITGLGTAGSSAVT